MELEQKDVRFELKELKDGTFTGYASVFGVKDDGDDIVVRGAFAQSLSELKARNRKVPMLWSHNSQEPIGVYSEVKEDDYGLWVEGKFASGVKRADEIHSLMKEGAVDGMSIGFRTKRHEYETETGVRKLMEVQLFEISVCMFPMLGAARVESVKTAFNPRDLERAFKDAGLSGNDAVKAVKVVKESLHREGGGKTTSARDEKLVAVLEALRQGRKTITP